MDLPTPAVRFRYDGELNSAATNGDMGQGRTMQPEPALFYAITDTNVLLDIWSCHDLPRHTRKLTSASEPQP
jgi:hypothetical protein